MKPAGILAAKQGRFFVLRRAESAVYDLFPGEKKGMNTMKRWVFLALAALLTALSVTVHAGTAVTSKEQLNQPGMKVGVSTGSASMLIAEKELPNATLCYYENDATAYEAVVQGKIDAYVYARRPMQLAIDSGLKGARLLDENMTEALHIAVGISPVSPIPELENKLNAFIAEMKANGTLDDMLVRWVDRNDETMPDIPAAENPTYHLTVGTSGVVPPYTYYTGTELNGYDIELARRFAAWLGADLSFKVYDYGAIVPAAVSGDVDCIMANLNVTPERREALPFSDDLFIEEIGILVRGEPDAPQAQTSAYTTLSQLDGKRIGVQTGTTFDEIVAEAFPNAKISYFNSYPDMTAALLANKIDAFPGDEPVMRLITAENDKLAVLDGQLDSFEFGFVLPKTEDGEKLMGELNAWLVSMRVSGELDKTIRKWTDGTESEKTVPDYASLPAKNGTLKMATEGVYAPMNYYRGEEVVGMEIDLAAQFCEANGYGLTVEVLSFDGILPAVQAGKTDFAAAGISITEERRERVNFSAPYYTGGTVLAVLKDKGAQTQTGSQGVYTSLDQLDGKRIGVQTGTTAADIARSRLPNIEISYFTTFPDMAMALKTHKIDGFPGDGLVLKKMAHEDPSLVVLDEMLRTYDCGFVLAKTEKGRALQAEMNEWIRKMRESGELDRILIKWTEGPESEQIVPEYKSLPAPKGTLTMTTEGTFPPMNYYRGEECVGMEIELCALFCRDCGYGLNVTTMDFDGMLAAVQSGKVDFAISGIAITEERKESVLFSDPYYTGGNMMAVLKGNNTQAQRFPTGRYTAIAQLATAKIGVQTGQSFDAAVKEKLPQAEIVYVNSKSDLLNSLISGKIDAFAVDEPVVKALARQSSSITAIPEYLEQFDLAYVFPQTEAGQALCGQFNDFIEKIKADGTLEALEQKWNSETEKKDMPDVSSLSPVNGTLTMATEALYEPFTYIQDGRIVGYDIEIVVRFCQEYGYGLEIVDMIFDGILPAVMSGKCDFGGAGITITPERAQSVLFSVPNFSSGTLLAVLKAEEASKPGFLEEIRASFSKTFIREGRWKLFVSGIGATLLITVLSVLFGTLLGFIVFMLCRNGSRIANGATRFCLWLVQGMPMVVLLMILYYIIFGKVSISGLAVAVIGFTLTFGASVFGLLKMGVGAIDRGQYEAAFALGYTNRRTFFRIILPQAIPHVMPAFKGEIVGLIKATAIVGYIAVQDLTKMGDIVRSRTYEAFFPLIAVTVIYFVLEGLIGLAVSRIEINLNPKRRRRESILKGVKTDD